jgi:DNA-directed RNA polymerase subunit RPC12/RpoP
MCKEFFKYHDKDITKYTEYPYIAYLNYLDYKRAKEDAEYADLHCGESPKYHFGETVINTTKQQQQKYTPKCPTCGSPNIRKISMGSKIFGGAMFGLFSSNVRNTMKCNNCGYKW